jgi:hypothetical protein
MAKDKNNSLMKVEPRDDEVMMYWTMDIYHPFCEISNFLEANSVDTEIFMTRVQEPHQKESLGIIQCGYKTDVIGRPADLFHEPYPYMHQHFIISDSKGIIEPYDWYCVGQTSDDPDAGPPEWWAFPVNMTIKSVDVTATILFADEPLFDAFYEGYKILIVPDCPHARGEGLYYTANSTTYPQHGTYKGTMPLGKYSFRCVNPDGDPYHSLVFTPDTINVTYDYKPTVPLKINFDKEPIDGYYTINIHRNEVCLIMEYVEDNCPVYNYEDLDWEIVIDGKDLGHLDCTSVFGIVSFKEAGTHFFCMGTICREVYVTRRTKKIRFNKELHLVQLNLDISIDGEHKWNDEIKVIQLNVDYRCPRAGANDRIVTEYPITPTKYMPIIDVSHILELSVVDAVRGWYNLELVFVFNSSSKVIKRTLEHQVLVNLYTFNFYFNTDEIYGNSLPCQLSLPFGELSETVAQYSLKNKKYNKVERIYQNFGKTEFDELNLDTYEYKITTIDKDNKYNNDNVLISLPLPLTSMACVIKDPYETLGVILPNSLVTVSANVYSDAPNSMYQVVVNFADKEHPMHFGFEYRSQILDAYTDSLLNYSFISPNFVGDDYLNYFYTISIQRVEDIVSNTVSKSNEIWYVSKVALYPTIPREFIHNCAWSDKCPYITIDGIDSSIFGINKRDFIIDKPANQLLASINSQTFDSNLMDGSINTIDKYEDIELTIPIIFKMKDVTFQQQMAILNYIVTRYLKNKRVNNVFRPHILKFSFDDYFYEATLTDEIEPQIDDDNIQKFTFDLVFTINPNKKYKNYMEIGDWDEEQNRLIMIGEVPLNTYISPLFIFGTTAFNNKDSVVSIKIEEIMSKQIFMIHGYVTKERASDGKYGREFIIDIADKRIWMDKREITLDIPLIIGDIKLKGGYDLQFNLVHLNTIVYGKQYYDL